MAATVKSAGVGTAPRSILRTVSSATPAAAAMLLHDAVRRQVPDETRVGRRVFVECRFYARAAGGTPARGARLGFMAATANQLSPPGP